jgi:hypothetical protein
VELPAGQLSIAVRFKLHTPTSLRHIKIDWDAPVERSDDVRAAMAAHDIDAMRAGVLVRGFTVDHTTYPRGTIVFRVAEGHEHFLQVPAAADAAARVATPLRAATWEVERVGTVDRYRGVLGTREHGERVDVVLAASIAELSRASVQRLIAEHRVRVRGQVVGKANQRLRTGDAIEVDVELAIVN